VSIRTSIRVMCVALLPAVMGGCGFVFTHGPPANHEQLDYIPCTEGNTGPILDVVWGALNLVGSIALATDQSYTQEEANQIIAGGVVWAGLYGAAAAVGFGKTKRCKAARQQLAARQAQLQEVGRPQPAGGGVVQDVVVGPSEATLEIGEQVQLVATAMNSSGSAISNKAFTWSSSNNAVASVSRAGLVTAHATGSVTIAATTENVTGTARIVVSSLR
jgi:Big-like domain-containing protein